MSRNNHFFKLLKKLVTKRKPRKAINILFVDDDVYILDSLKSILTSLNYNVECARDAQEGIDLFKQNKFDLVITDYMMPGKNGIELMIEIKKTDSKIPVLIFTGFGTKALLDEAVKLGAAGLIIKGESINCIIQTVEKSVGRAE